MAPSLHIEVLAHCNGLCAYRCLHVHVGVVLDCDWRTQLYIPSLWYSHKCTEHQHMHESTPLDHGDSWHAPATSASVPHSKQTASDVDVGAISTLAPVR